MKRETTILTAWSGGAALVALTALAKFAAHLLTASNYGYFRDELYYLAASKRLDLGYVDFPLFIAWATALIRATLGESLLALHIVPAALGALTVLLTGQMAKEMGGGRGAQVLAALAALVMPIFLLAHSLLTMDAFDELWWVLAMFAALKVFRSGQPRGWLWFGLFAGLGLLTKVTMLYLGAAIAVALLLTGARKHLTSRWLWLGGLLAAAFLLPYLIWQVQHDFPTLEFWKSYAASKTYPVTPLEFLAQQVFIVQPLGFLLALAGVAALFFWKPLKAYRAFGWVYLILFSVFAVQQAKAYFLAPAYPVLFAAGAVAFERWTQGARRGWLMPAYAALLLIAGMVTAPSVLPVLSPEAYRQYAERLGSADWLRTERLATSFLPQVFADRFGWTELADTVGAIAQRLSPEERARACIFTENYGEAGALEFFGGGRLPHVISAHNSYHLWGPGACDGSVIILVNSDLADAQAAFAQVEVAGVMQCQYCMPYENRAPIVIGRRLRAPMADVWKGTRHFD